MMQEEMTMITLDEIVLETGEHDSREDGLGAMDGLRARFFSKVRKSDSCWVWQGTRNSQGYGSIRNEFGRMERTHRVSWRLANGCIPKGEGPHGTCVLHRCDTPSCVNPDHLFLGTNRDNAIDRQHKGRTRSLDLGPKKNAAKPHCPAGHPVNAENTGRRKNGTRYCRVCSRQREQRRSATCN